MEKEKKSTCRLTTAQHRPSPLPPTPSSESSSPWAQAPPPAASRHADGAGRPERIRAASLPLLWPLSSTRPLLYLARAPSPLSASFPERRRDLVAANPWPPAVPRHPTLSGRSADHRYVACAYQPESGSSASSASTGSPRWTPCAIAGDSCRPRPPPPRPSTFPDSW
jgi:hypothetical protein